MLTLALDTATETLALAIAGDSGLLSRRSTHAGRNHLEILLPQIQSILSENDAGFVDLGRLITGLGPGTFSGLRVGIATARGLSQALGAEIIGVSTLHALALGISKDNDSEQDLILPIIDAKRGQVFVQLFSCGSSIGSLKALSGIKCLDPVELAAFTGEYSETGIIAGGNGALQYREVVETIPGVYIPPSGNTLHGIDAARLLEIGLANSGGNVDAVGETDDLHIRRGLAAVTPIYVREPDADKTVLLRKREPWLK